ncbi:MAG: glutamate--cysteine ligase, partial [Cyanobacteriota bacterium]
RLDPIALAELADANDRAAAARSLEAPLRHWRTGETVLARDWIRAELEAMAPLAVALGLDGWLEPLQPLLSDGNQAMRWLAAHAGGADVARLVASGAEAMERREAELTARLATDPTHALG